MEAQVIEVEQRGTRGKGAARKLRASGKIPGVLYGHKEEPQAFQVSPKALRRTIRTAGTGRNTLFKVTGLAREVMALLKDAQMDPVRRDLLHIDFIEVREGDSVLVDVPLEFTGKSLGVVEGGERAVMRRSIEVRTSPLSIPKLLEVDVSELNIGDVLHASDISLPEGVEVTNGKLALVGIKAPRVEEKPAEEGVEGEEGAVPAEGEGAEGADAAPAEGAPEGN